MARSRLITGLDVGTTKICAVTAEASHDGCPNVIGVGISPCAGLKKGTVVDLELTTASIRDAVGKAERMAGEEIGSVVVGVTGEHVACLNSRTVIAITHPSREISPGDVSRLNESSRVMVLPPDREIVHAIPRWYAVDGQPGSQSPVGMHGSRLEVETHVVTGLSSFIRNVVKCVNDAGLPVEATILEPIATGESVLSKDERELGVALVDIGGGTSDVAVYQDGQTYYSGAVPVGGNHVTRDIAVGLRAAIDEAERAKLAHGSALVDLVGENEAFRVTSLGSSEPRSLPRRVLAEIIEPRMAEICQLVVGQLDKAGCMDRVPAGIVLTGGGSQVHGLTELVLRTTGLPGRLGVPGGITGLAEEVSSPSCATAVGLVLFCMRHYAGNVEDDDSDTFLHHIVRRIRQLLAKIGAD